jgi:carboxyl-terminal processing protease
MSLKVRSILVIVVGVVLGLTVSLSSGLLAPPPPGHAQARPFSPPVREDMRLLAAVLERVRQEYVDEIDDHRLVEAAIRGVLRELDSHSQYLDPEAFEETRISASGNYTGVGLDVSLEQGKVTVVAPLEGAPADKAGILAGDVIVSVDDVPVEAEDVDASVRRMRGRAGTQVTLDVLREGADRPLRFALTRSEIHVRTVESAYLGQGFAYLKIGGFADTTGADLRRAIETIEHDAGQRLRGVVLDLRNNPGGVLDAAVEVSDAFLDGGLIVRGKGRVDEARFARYAQPGDLIEGAPLTVLVNGGSASASEIVAGALKDHHRARLVGERTYGKGSVQTVMPLSEGSAIKLTTSRYLTPSGASISGKGIVPDVIVRRESGDHLYQGGGEHAVDQDTQLREALRLMGYTAVELSKAP